MISTQIVNFLLKLEIPLFNCHIFYFDNFKSLFVHLGTYPFKQDICLKLEIFIETHIQIRYIFQFNNLDTEKYPQEIALKICQINPKNINLLPCSDKKELNKKL
jgi:hypothetical protein